MSPALNRRLAAALALSTGLGVAGCGGSGEPLEAPALRTVGAASTLLDDDGLPMPSDPGAVPAGVDPRTLPRHATVAQAEELQRALGAAALRVEVGCCGAAAADAAIARARRGDGVFAFAVLLDGSDRAATMQAALSLHAAGLERVWVVSP